MMFDQQEQWSERVLSPVETNVQKSYEQTTDGEHSARSTARVSRDNAALTDEQYRDESETCSEVARILKQISEEYEAAQRGFTGLASGTCQHAFITARMEQMSYLQSQLQDLVGDAAPALVAEKLNSCHDVTRLSGL